MKRQATTGERRTMNKDQRSTVRNAFEIYLEKHAHRKTPERFSILEEVYSLDGHFDVESLYSHIKNKNYRISRATVYNTIELLLDAKLISRHQFGKNLAKFEKSFEYRQHDHLICQNCEKVFEFCDPRVYQIQATMGDILQFEITHHSLNLFGKCKNIIATGHCENIGRQRNNSA